MSPEPPVPDGPPEPHDASGAEPEGGEVPDAVVRAALRLLPVPPHRATFWHDLDAQLADTDGGTGTVVALPTVDPATPGPDAMGDLTDRDDTDVRAIPARPGASGEASLAVVPPALRRRSNALLLAAAAAAAVVVGVAGTTLLRERDTSTSPAVETAGLEGTDDEPPSGEPPATLVASPDDQEVAQEAVLRFMGGAQDGEADVAWDLMADGSKAAFDDQAAFEEHLAGLAERYSAWSDASAHDVLVTPVASDDGDLLVVTLVERTDEAPDIEVIPVRIVGDAALIDLFGGAGEVEFVVPEVPEGASTAAASATVEGEEVIVVVPDGVAAPVIRLDEGTTVVCGSAPGTELTSLDGLPGQRCAYEPDGGITAGAHVLTVAFTSSDGAQVAADSVHFRAA